MGCWKEEEFILFRSNQKQFLKYSLKRQFHILIISLSLEWKYILKCKTIQQDENSCSFIALISNAVCSQTPEAGSIDTDSHYLAKHQGCGVPTAYK